MSFIDRADAGRRLAEKLRHLRDRKPVVLALPRGGVPVGFEIAHELDAPLDIAGRTVIVVDDGIATGATIRVALWAARRRNPAWLVLAAPVAAPDTIAKLRPEADEVVCVDMPAGLGTIGFYYTDFHQVGDAEVTEILARAAEPSER